MEIIQIEDADLQAIEGDRCRLFRAISESLTAQVIKADIDIHNRKRVIIICNTVSQAQGLFKDLKQINQDEKLNITLLHSRFLPEHRARKEAFLKKTFAENWQNDDICYVLISTQVIEVGINITCEVMHTQLCPMNSLLQRAGRCARFQDEQGKVFIYRTVEVTQAYAALVEADVDSETEESTDKKQRFLPYPNETCELTWQVLQAHSESNQANENVGFRTEEQWINHVHTAEDLLQQQRRQNKQMQFEQDFESALFRGEKYASSELIRLVDNRIVFIGHMPESDDTQINPDNLPVFSLPISILCKVYKEAKASSYRRGFMFWQIESPPGKKAETYSQAICSPIQSIDVLKSNFRLFVNIYYTYYDSQIGLLIGTEESLERMNVDVTKNEITELESPQKLLKNEYRYQMDNYVGHLVLMWKCWREPFLTTILKDDEPIKYISVRDELLKAGGKLIKNKIFPHIQESEAEALFEILVFLAIFTHDLGKLQIKWQDVMRGWQAIAFEQFQNKSPCSNPRSHLLAHTDYDPEDKTTRDSEGRTQKQRLIDYEKQYKRPNHAVESAYLAQDILKQSLIPLLRDHFAVDDEQMKYICHTVIMAAGRHHSAWASGWDGAAISQSNIKSIQLHPQAKLAIADSWRSMTRFLPQSLPLPKASLSKDVYPIKNKFDLNRFTSDQTEYLQLYLLVVRALRLCDQRSVQLHNI